MPAALDSAQLTALAALLETARDLVGDLAKDGSSAKLMRAFRRLDPEEREVLATAFERAVGWRKVNESVAPINGVHLRVNPNPRLFVRVVDADAPPPAISPDPDEVLVGTLRLLRQAQAMIRPEGRAVWEPALAAAFEILEPDEREACIAFADAIAAVLRTASGGTEPSRD